MARYIAFNLFGGLPLYARGMHENIRLAPEVYPGWTVVLYADAAGMGALRTLGPLPGACTIVERPTPSGSEGFFWRFEAAMLPDAEWVVFRDADSRLNVREKSAVDEWIALGAPAHTMHDHPQHATWPVLAGMWGLRPGAAPWFEGALRDWTRRVDKFDDQHFLAYKAFPHFFREAVHHASVPLLFPITVKPFPPHPYYPGYVGEVVPPPGVSAAEAPHAAPANAGAFLKRDR
jgi:hypothetical protein